MTYIIIIVAVDTVYIYIVGLGVYVGAADVT
jgi:hypothetical protein